VAAQTHELSPAAAIGMTIGANIAKADPAVIRTSDIRAEVAGGLDLAPTAASERHPRWRRARRRRVRCGFPSTQVACGLAGETRERFGFTRWPGRLRRCWSGLAAAPESTAAENEENEDNKRERIENQVGSHDQPFH
jgi:hypothetical protein